MLDVACCNGHLCGLGDGGDEGVVERRVFGYSVRGKDPRGRQVKRQYAAGERWENVLVEPAAQDSALSGVR